MSYEPTQWAVGDKITAAKMNKIEDGIANRSLKVIVEEQNNDLVITSHTWQEIYDAMDNGIIVIAKYETYLSLVQGVNQDGTIYRVYIGEMHFYCSSPDDYPILEQAN